MCYAVLCYGMLHHGRIYATKSRQIQYKTRRKLNQQKHKTRGEKYINILLHRRVKVVGIRWWGRRWWWQWRWWRWQWRWWRWWSNGEQVKVANRKRNSQPKNRSRNRKQKTFEEEVTQNNHQQIILTQLLVLYYFFWKHPHWMFYVWDGDIRICTTKARKRECEREREKQKKIVCCFVSSPSLDSWLCTLRHHTTTIKRTNKSCAAKNNEKLFEIFLIILLNCLRWWYPSFDQSVVGSSDATAAWNTHTHKHTLTHKGRAGQLIESTLPEPLSIFVP